MIEIEYQLDKKDLRRMACQLGIKSGIIEKYTLEKIRYIISKMRKYDLTTWPTFEDADVLYESGIKLLEFCRIMALMIDEPGKKSFSDLERMKIISKLKE